MQGFKTEKMSVEDFLKIPDNPIQRNTFKHAASASRPGGHLSELSPTHHRVSIAVTAKGKKWVLDGHSRRFLWEQGELEQPNELLVDVYQVKDQDEAQELYLMFDNYSAVENSGDRLFGAMRYHKFTPHTTIFQNSGTIGALKRLAFPTKWSDLGNLPFTKLVEPWISTFEIIDNSHHAIKNHMFFPSWVMLVMLLTVRRDKQIAMSFWEAYALDEGTKAKKSMDGIYAARMMHDFVRENMSGKGNTMIAIYSSPLLHIYEQWKAGKRFPVGGAGTSRWGLSSAMKFQPLSKWWQENIGEYDHPQIRSQQSLLGDDGAD